MSEDATGTEAIRGERLTPGANRVVLELLSRDSVGGEAVGTDA